VLLLSVVRLAFESLAKGKHSNETQTKESYVGISESVVNARRNARRRVQEERNWMEHQTYTLVTKSENSKSVYLGPVFLHSQRLTTLLYSYSYSMFFLLPSTALLPPFPRDLPLWLFVSLAPFSRPLFLFSFLFLCLSFREKPIFINTQEKRQCGEEGGVRPLRERMRWKKTAGRRKHNAHNRPNCQDRYEGVKESEPARRGNAGDETKLRREGRLQLTMPYTRRQSWKRKMLWR